MRWLIVFFLWLSLAYASAQTPLTTMKAGPEVVSTGGGGCTAATNYLARTVGGNEGGNGTNISNLICGLVTDGVITGNLSGATGGCGRPLTPSTS